MKSFYLNRLVDIYNQGFVGIIAEGVIFSDGSVVIKWIIKNSPSSIVLWKSIEDVKQVNCRDDNTVIEYMS
jgi:hypothetical protein